MKKENAINFLLYCLLGVTLDSSKEELLEAAIKRAYQDASSHVFSVRNKKKKDTVKKEAAKRIITAIEDELNGTDYDTWHRELCKKLVAAYSNVETVVNKSFTYGVTHGIAQKWVNMTMKYLFVLKAIYKEYNASWPSELEFLERYEKVLHVPIDGYIIEAVWGEDVYLPLKDGADRGKPYKHPHKYVKAWSTWDGKTKNKNEEPCNPYKKFQNDIKKVIEKSKSSPLDWENRRWINVAQHRKGGK